MSRRWPPSFTAWAPPKPGQGMPSPSGPGMVYLKIAERSKFKLENTPCALMSPSLIAIDDMPQLGRILNEE